MDYDWWKGWVVSGFCCNSIYWFWWLLVVYFLLVEGDRSSGWSIGNMDGSIGWNWWWWNLYCFFVDWEIFCCYSCCVCLWGYGRVEKGSFCMFCGVWGWGFCKLLVCRVYCVCGNVWFFIFGSKCFGFVFGLWVLWIFYLVGGWVLFLFGRWYLWENSKFWCNGLIFLYLVCCFGIFGCVCFG